MGKAFHRKQISIDRNHTSGIGFKYTDAVPHIHILTPEQIAVRKKEAQQQGVLGEQRRQRRENIESIVRVAGMVLRHWKEGRDYNDQRLIEFAGWTTPNYCTLPVDKDLASAYAEMIQRYTSQADEPVSLEELDEVIAIGCQRNVPTEQVVKEATKAVRSVAQACTYFDGYDVAFFIRMLSKRAVRAKTKNSDLDFALEFVRDQLFQPLIAVAA
jgi:hypothetical protein